MAPRPAGICPVGAICFPLRSNRIVIQLTTDAKPKQRLAHLCMLRAGWRDESRDGKTDTHFLCNSSSVTPHGTVRQYERVGANALFAALAGMFAVQAR